MLKKKFQVIEEGVMTRDKMKNLVGGWHDCPNDPDKFSYTQCKILITCSDSAYQTCQPDGTGHSTCSGSFSSCPSHSSSLTSKTALTAKM